MLLAGAAIYTGAGCGGSLSGGTGGTGGVAGGTAGTSGTAATSGTAGTSSTAGGPGDDGGGAAGSPYDGVTATWADVTVQIGPTNLAPGNLTMHVIDPTMPASGRAFTYPSATRFSPENDGADVTVLYGCSGPTVERVTLLSCATGGISGGTRTPGCIGVTFDQLGPRGNFMDTDGTSCTVATGSASFHIPRPVSSPAAADGSAGDAASGSFNLDCVRPDGTHLNLNARFVIPVESSFLAC